MPERYGTLAILDTLATYNNTSVISFGEEQMAGYVQQILDAYAALNAELFSEFSGVVPSRETTYGINASTGEMVEVDEYGLADAQKIPFAPSSVGFPLRRSQYAIQWTRDYLAVTSPRELAVQVLGATEADERKQYRDIRRTLLKATNTTTYVDRLVDNRTFTLRALVNADSQGIPPHPITAVSFDAATHTHYLATAALVEANVLALIETVREHRTNAAIRIYINVAQEAAYRAFANFNPYVDSRLVYATDATRAAQTVNLQQLEDRAIGFLGIAEVWVKPWVPALYHIALDTTSPEPVVGVRQPTGVMAQFANLRLVAELDRHPLHAQAWEHQYGMSIWNRVGAAVLYSGGGTYVSYTGV